MTLQSVRPKVALTVGTVEGKALTQYQQVLLRRVLTWHGQPNRDGLIYACLECGCIGEVTSMAGDLKADRDRTAKQADFTCCPGETVLFTTKEI